MLDAIAAIAKRAPGAHVGRAPSSNLVRSARPLRPARSFWSAPALRRGWPKPPRKRPFFLPGVATLTEAMALRERGFRALKSSRGSGRRRETARVDRGPLPDLVFCPTGGIDLAKAPSYLALPNVICVGGSWMLPKAALEARDYAGVEALSREATRLLRSLQA